MNNGLRLPKNFPAQARDTFRASWPPPLDTMIDDPARQELQERKGRPFQVPEHGTDADCVQVAPGVWCVGGKVGIARQSVTLAEAQSGVERYSVYMNTTDLDVAKRLAKALVKAIHPETG